MNILHITTYVQGGAGKVIRDLVLEQKKNGHKVIVIMNEEEEPGYENYGEYINDFKDNNIYLNGEILKDEIRTMEVSNNVSNVAKIKELRYLMVDVQRNIGKVSSVILDGRDIGSYVFPNADYKFFLVATPEERGKRRYKELVNKGYDVNLEEIISDLIKRDEIDSNREFAPLVKADDAIEIDTTGKSINEVVQSVLSKINI